MGSHPLKRVPTDVMADAVLVHRDELVRFVVRVGAARSDAEDLAQEVCLRALSAKQDLPELERLRPFLFRMARNLLLDQVRRSARQAHPRDGVVVDDLPSRLPGSEELASAAERARLVRAALMQLPEQQRLALVLHRFHGLSHRESAEIVGTTETSLRSSLYLAVKKLRHLLAPLLTEES